MDPQRHFETLVKAHSTELFRYAMAQCGDPHQAEDIVQEVFLRAWRHLDKLREPKAVRGWLYTILKNEHARLYRNGRRETEALDEELLAARCCFDTSTEAFALRCAIRRLPLSYREPLLLQSIGGFSSQEIADMLETSQSAVLARLSRGRRKLREVLEQQEPQPQERRLKA